MSLVENSKNVWAGISQALHAGDKTKARELYFTEVLKEPGISHQEAISLSYRVGAIDEGDRYLAEGQYPPRIIGGALEKKARPIRIVEPRITHGVIYQAGIRVK